MTDDRASAHQRGYGVEWRRARKAFLQQHPLCWLCQEQGRLTASTTVDHITPHRGDRTLFWDRRNWRALCKTHHDSIAQSKDHSGVMRGCDESGWPIDPAHWWN